jgi:hypothetical protein
MVLGFLRCRSPLQVATVFWLLAGGRRPYNAGTGLATKFISFLKQGHNKGKRIIQSAVMK